MRIATYDHGNVTRVGIVSADAVTPVDATVLQLLQAPPGAREALAEPVGDPLALVDVRLRPPLQPATLRDFVSFEQHIGGAVKNAGPDATIPPAWFAAPRYFLINPYSVVGPDDPVAIPPGCEVLDLELELAAVIGTAGSNLTPEQARHCVAGYTIMNDWSARDLQIEETAMGTGPQKGKDFATTLGPWIVTADELEPFRVDDRLDVRMTAEINGEQIGAGDTAASMAWSFEELVAYASRGSWVRPGDVIGSGTAGDGCLLERWGRSGKREPGPLEAGDSVTLKIEGIGAVSNVIVAGVKPIEIPTARRRLHTTAG